MWLPVVIAALAELADQLAGHVRLAAVGGDHDAFVRRAVEQLLELGIDFGMVTERERDARLLGAGAAVAADDVQGCSVHGAILPAAAYGRIRRPRDSGAIPDRTIA